MPDYEEYFGTYDQEEIMDIIDSYREDEDIWSKAYGVPDGLACKLINKIHDARLSERAMQNLEFIATILSHGYRFDPELLATLAKCANACDKDFMTFYKDAVSNSQYEEYVYDEETPDEPSEDIPEDMPEDMLESIQYKGNWKDDDIPF